MSDQSSAPAASRPASSGIVRRWAPAAILVVGLITAYAAGLHEYLTLSAIAENRETLMASVHSNFVLAVAVYVVVYAGSVAFSLPGAALLTILGGFLFGWLVGGLVTVVAATLGAVAVFIAAKTSLGESLASRAGPWMTKLRDGFRKDAFNYLLFLRLVPVFPFWLVNIAPALAGVGLQPYTLATALGIIPGTFAFSVLGSGLDSIIMAQKAVHQDCIASEGAENCTFSLDVSALVTPQLLAAFAALGIVALIPVVVKKLRSAKQSRQ